MQGTESINKYPVVLAWPVAPVGLGGPCLRLTGSTVHNPGGAGESQGFLGRASSGAGTSIGHDRNFRIT